MRSVLMPSRSRHGRRALVGVPFAFGVGAIAIVLACACGNDYSDAASGLDAMPAEANYADAAPANDVALTGNAADVAIDHASSLPECTAQRVVSIVGGNGGFAHFTQVWPVPVIITGYNPMDAYDDPTLAISAPGSTAQHPLFARIFQGKAVLDGTGAHPMPSVFVEGTNQTHTSTPTQTDLAGVDIVAAGVVAQASLHPTLAALVFQPGTLGPAVDGGAAPFSSASSIDDAVSALKAITVITPMVEAELRPDTATINEWLGIPDGSAVSLTLTTLAEYLIFTANAFRLGLVGTVTMPAFRDDPNGFFAAGPAAAEAFTGELTSMLHHFYATLATNVEPTCSHAGATLSLADNVVMVVSGDTPKNPFNMNDWPDGTPNNSNWIYVRSNGWLVPGWFGAINNATSTTNFDPNTGLLAPGEPDAGPPQSAALLGLLFAITRGNTPTVATVSSASYDGVVSLVEP